MQDFFFHQQRRNPQISIGWVKHFCGARKVASLLLKMVVKLESAMPILSRWLHEIELKCLVYYGKSSQTPPLLRSTKFLLGSPFSVLKKGIPVSQFFQGLQKSVEPTYPSKASKKHSGRRDLGAMPTRMMKAQKRKRIKRRCVFATEGH